MISKRKGYSCWADSRGFTVVELLVASAVTIVISLIMIAMISNVLTAWARLSGMLHTQSQARLVMEVMMEDLQAAYFQNDGNVWLAASVLHGTDATQPDRGWMPVQNSQWEKPTQEGDPAYLRLLPEFPLTAPDPPSNPNDPPDGAFNAETMPWRYGTGGTWLRFFTMGSDPSGDQMVRAVAYQIVRRPVTSAPSAEVRYMLYRSAVSANETISAGYHLGTIPAAGSFPPTPADLYGIDVTAGTPPNSYYDADTTAGHNGDPTAGEPGVIRRPPPSTLIANDVIDFGVRLYQRDPATGQLLLLFPTRSFPPLQASGVASSGGRHYFAGERNANGDLISPFPDVMDVFIRVLTPEGVKEIQNYENLPTGATASRTWWEIAEEHSQVFVRRVQLRR